MPSITIMDINIFEQIGNNSSKIHFIFDIKDRHFTYLNQAVEAVFGGELQSFLNEPGFLLQAVHPEDRELLVKHFEQLLQGIPGQVKFRIVHAGGNDKVILAEAFPITENGQGLRYLAGQAEDITGRIEYVAYLMEFGQKKNSALEILSHDLRGPLAMVQSVSSLLETDHLEQNYAELTTYTSFITKACESCVTLIANVLSEEHLKSPTIVVHKERVDIVEKVKQVVDFYLLNKGISQKFSLQAPMQAFVMADIVKLDQIINNLISNSVKFTQTDGVISISIEQEEKTVLLKHSDNGIGIPPHMMPYLFDKYSRAAREGIRGEMTTGIGMSIVRDLVQVQGGEIWCESEEGKGTTFFVRLPGAE